MNLQEQISRIQSMMGTINEGNFFKIRVDLNRVEHLLKVHANQVFFETESYEQFRYELTLRAVEAVMWQEYNMGWEDLPGQEEIDYVNQVAEMYNDKIRNIYNKLQLR